LISSIEKQIVNLLGQSDKKAITLLYENYADALLGVIKKIISDDNTAQDVLQESFVKIWRYSKKYDASTAILFRLVYRIAFITAIELVRAH
jgi:RNA polymerase sigma-70 factor (ECF subfamily)